MTSQDFPSDDGPRAGRPKRRTFSAAYKLRMVQEYDTAPTGEKGALLRREGLYESSISSWRRQRDAGQLTSSGSARSAVKKEKSPEQAELEQLRREKARLERQNAAMARKIRQTEAALDIMGKGIALLETVSESADTENS